MIFGSMLNQVAEKLANEAVKPERQYQIVRMGGYNSWYELEIGCVELSYLLKQVPLTESEDEEVRRMAAHCLANLSVNGERSSNKIS